ncbi:MAG: glycosyltransferase family 39 protein [Planctomycetota bacterium]
MNDCLANTISQGGASPFITTRLGWPDALLLAAILAIMVWGLGSYGLYEPHEAHFAGVGREMVARGDWITPHLNGAPYLNKPPLFYWLIGGSCALFGVNEFAARLPLALIGWCGALLAWRWAMQLWGLRAARGAAAMLTVSVGWHVFCHQLLIDALLSVLNFASIYFLWRATLSPHKRGRWAAFYVTLGAAVLAKGLIGLALPLGLLVIYALIRRDRVILKQCRPLLGLLIVGVMVLPWLLCLEFHNPGVVTYMLINEHWRRLFDKRDPPDYSVVRVSSLAYIGVTLVWMAPWFLLLPQTGMFAYKESRAKAARSVADAVLLLALGALLPVLIFLPIPARLIYYSLPTLPPFIMLTAGWWATADNEVHRFGRRAAAGTLLLTGVAVAGCGFFMPILLKNVHPLTAVLMLPDFISGVAFAFGGALIIGGFLLALNRTTWALTALIAALAVVNLRVGDGFIVCDNIYSAKQLVENLHSRIDDDVIWISEGSKEIGGSAGLSFYLGADAMGQARTVFVMDDDVRRPPPKFPVRPQYLINHAELKIIWSGCKPALFVTDFQRDWSECKDQPLLPDGDVYQVEVRFGGHRRVFANQAAWDRFPKLHQK